MNIEQSNREFLASKRHLGCRFACSSAYGRVASISWTHSSSSPLQTSPDHPQVAQRKQRRQLRRVLSQTPVAHLGIIKLPLDHPKRMFYLGSDARLGALKLANQLIDGLR